jgi:hypothetical protein
MASLMKTIKTKHTPNGPPKGSLRAAPKVRFIESMECLPVSKLPRGPEWSYEIKLDGFRLSAVKKNGETTLFSRRANILNPTFHSIACNRLATRMWQRNRGQSHVIAESESKSQPSQWVIETLAPSVYAGVFQCRVSRGRVFSFLATVSNWAWLTAERSAPLG